MNGNKGAPMQRKRLLPLAAFPVLTSEEVHQDGSATVPDPPPAFPLSPLTCRTEPSSSSCSLGVGLGPVPRKSLGFYCSVECTHLPLEETAQAALSQQESQGFVGIQAGAKLNEQEAKGNALGGLALGRRMQGERNVEFQPSGWEQCPEQVVSDLQARW